MKNQDLDQKSFIFYIFKICEEKIAESPTQENLANLESVKTEYEQEYDYIVRGSIIRSRATWFEQGERNNKYFLIADHAKL